MEYPTNNEKVIKQISTIIPTLHIHIYMYLNNMYTICCALRWMKMWGISIAAEGKMRQEARELVGDEVHSELVPFSFSHKDGGEVIKSAAMAYITDVWGKIQDLLEKNDENHTGYNNSTNYITPNNII